MARFRQDNPYVGKDGARPEIWSYGHRNVQAAALNPETGELWEIEHGPKGGDELNVAEAGKNYGWPVISYGVNYSGTPVGSGKSKARRHGRSALPMDAGDRALRHDVLLGQARARMGAQHLRRRPWLGGLVRLEMEGRKVVHEERLLEDLGERIRDVVEGPDGAIYVATDADNGKILKIAPGS